MYFGNKNRMIDVPCPAINIDRGTGRWESAGTYLNGGAYQISSGYAHRRYGVSWNLLSADSVRRITDYYHNVFGDGLIYMLDPFIEKRNTLPLNWSVPVLGLLDAPTLVYDTLPTRQQAATVAYTNLLTNPSFEATSGTVEVRRNLASDPRATSVGVAAGAAGWRNTRWGGQGSPSITYALRTGQTDGPEVTPGVKIDTYLRKTWNASPSSNSGSGLDNTTGNPDNPSSAAGDGLPATAGVTYSISSYLRASAANKNLWSAVAFQDAAGVRIGATLTGTTVAAVAGAWVRVSATFTAPAGTSRMVVTSQVATGGVLWVAGDTLDGTALLIEASSAVDAYFDQLVSPDPDLTPSATGTPNASPSVLTGARVAGVTGGVSIASTQWAKSGTKSLRVLSTAGSNYSAVGGDLGAMRNGMEVGKTYTAIATCRLAASQTGALDVNARRIVAYTRVGAGVYVSMLSAQAPNIAGEHEVRLTFTVPAGATEAFIRVFGGAPFAGGGDVWWDNAALVEGVYTGPAFNGDTPNTLLNAYTWTGTANASTTVLTAYPSVESGLPREAAQYTLTAESEPVEVFLPVPPGKVLHFGALGTKTGTAGVQLVTSMGAITNVSLLPVNSSQMTNTTVTESVTLRLTGTGTITLQALTARILDPGEVSAYNNVFIAGEGNSGLRFTGVPAVSGYSSVMDKQALSAALVETGAWEPQ